ncbi:MAG: integrase arm-type DNA-binding domain-containing protein [Proteobacteria bacterium]|nr:integrase arm-type DNA-binding domain-containing protein [Pseudomonadota bacterium]
MALTDLKIRRTKPQLKDSWVTDEKGLRMLIKPNGSRYWRLSYRYHGKQRTLALGVYPDVTLKMAREERDKAKRLLKKGIDPNQVKKEKKYQYLMNDSNTFSVLAEQWWNFEKGKWKKDHAERLWRRLKTNSFNIMDSKPINQIKPRDILVVVAKIEKRSALDVASRVLQDIRRVFSFAVKRGLLDINPAIELTGVVKTYKRKHQPSMQNHELGGFMRDLEEYGKRGFLITQYAVSTLNLRVIQK